MSSFRPCVVIPIFNHGSTIFQTVRDVSGMGIPSIVVDDGSDESTRNEIDRLPSAFADVAVIRFEENSGKGKAVCRGIRKAHELGYTHALQVDADGQHDLRDIPTFLARAQEHPDDLIIGNPIFDQSAPPARVWGRKISTLLVWLETGSFRTPDVLCGYRVYPIVKTSEVMSRTKLSPRMGFDVEIIVRLLWSGMKTIPIRTAVTYPPQGISHFRYGSDNLKFLPLHLRLVGERLLHILWPSNA